ncbi:hypothetical protein [Amycolatopsis sp. NPDC004169]|uniref:hypothetical protein n=1 Tax=Amycolatopsis sp. NPDC004169 TaxID=3154453 RepID=UPI0033AF4B84
MHVDGAGLAAVWAAGFRVADDQPAVLDRCEAARLEGVAADGHGVPCEVLTPASPG